MGEVAMTSTADQSKTSALRREAERLEEDTLYSSKGHFNIEGTWVRRNYWLGVPATVLGAVAGATLIKSQPEWATNTNFTYYAVKQGPPRRKLWFDAYSL
jgi:hypothetical protein